MVPQPFSCSLMSAKAGLAMAQAKHHADPARALSSSHSRSGIDIGLVGNR